MTIDRNINTNIGIIGLGYWGKNILRNFNDFGVVLAACDTNPCVIKQRRKEFPRIKYTLSSEDILQNPEIKAVAIVTPAITHYELVKRALNANKDVFVEKPLALDFQRGDELVKIAKEKGRILMVGHILQYHPAVITLKNMINKGELGKVQYIYSNRLNIGKLRVEENILWSFAPHDISVILMLLESNPIKVSCFGEDYLSEAIYDTTLTTLEFEDRVKGHIFVSWLHPFKEQKLIVVGSKAMAVFNDLAEEKLLIYPHKIEWSDGGVPIAQKAKHYCVKTEKKEPLKEEIRHFIDCVLKRKKPRTDGEEAVRVLKVLEEAEKSLGVQSNEKEKILCS